MASSVLEILRDNVLFDGVSDAGLDRIVESGRVEYWQDGALMLEEGSTGPRLMVLLEGRVEVLRRDPSGVPRSIAQLGPGEVLGEMSLLLELPRTATVRALTPVRVFAMGRAQFNAMIEEGDVDVLRFGLGLSRVLAERVMRLSSRVVDLLMAAEGSEPLRERFVEARQEIFRLWDHDPPDGELPAE